MRGALDRKDVGRLFRPFTPVRFAASLQEVDLAEFHGLGKKLILLDVDNTLVPWRSEAIPEWVFEWLKAGRDLGLEFCILSNTRHPARLARLSDVLGVPFLRGRFKPHPEVYRQALTKFQVLPSEALMLGDQLFTDVWGANRAGIEAIWVQPMSGRDFMGTKLSRMAEKVLSRHFRRRLERLMETVKPDETGGPKSP